MTDVSRASGRHLDCLDGLRALAALYVLVGHVRQGLLPFRVQSGALGLTTNWLLYNHLAVGVFIVLSGFCLMLPVARSGHLRGGAAAFFRRRARRILPPYYAAVALSVFLGALPQFHAGLWALPAQRTLVAHVLLLEDVFPDLNTLDSPLWSVAVECKIYLAFPLLVWAWRRFGPAAMLAGTAAAGYVVMGGLQVLRPTLSLDHLCPWYLFLFGMGACAAGVASGRPAQARSWAAALGALSTLALLVLLGASVALGRGDRYAAFVRNEWMIDPALGCATACLLIVLARHATTQRGSRVLRLLSWRPLVTLGAFSYSLYLVHMLARTFLQDPFMSALGRSGHAILLAGTAEIAVALGGSYLFHLAFERPFLSKPAVQAGCQPHVAGSPIPLPSECV